MMYRLIPVLMIVGATGLFFGYTQQAYSTTITGLRAEIRDLDTALRAAEEFKEKETELANERSQIPPEQLARLAAYLPDSVDNVQLIVDLNSLAARSGVALSEFTITQEQQVEEGLAPLGTEGAAASGGSPVESLELSVAASGSYAAFQTFLEGVENSLRPLDVVELSVRDSQTGVYTYNVTFRLYWLR